MPKYRYIRLSVMCLDRRYFGIEQMRRAVEYLRLQPQTGYTGLVAETHARHERFILHAQPMLQLKHILGKVPAEVWLMFDREVDRQVADLAERFQPRFHV